ncbi:RDD family protein [Phytoactinopolyspora limicola]|uniref:RDD family protein n=1 Tax=Phytoactinopolyspora limicola TaxID=2715536 RepID=UPI00140AC009|nr:RDD family protein [Phytoactinopolyspora limicola]
MGRVSGAPDGAQPPKSKGRLSRLAGAVTGRVVETIDPDTVIDHVDVDHLLDRVDVDRLLDRVDVNRLLERVGVDALLDRVDVDRLLDRVDVDRLLDRVDVDRLMDRVDVNRLVARVDFDAALNNVDLEAAVRRAGVPEIVAESTGRMAGSVLDLARRQIAGLDIVVDRIVNKVLRRDSATQPLGPPALVGQTTGAPGQGALDGASRLSVTGHYAGVASRAVSALADLGIVIVSFTAGLAGIDVLARVLWNAPLGDDLAGPAWTVALAGWAFLYVYVSLMIAGRTVGKGMVGLRVVAAEGGTLSGRRALGRTLTFPLSALVAGVGFLLIIVQREHRALHDLLAGTAVVYDWGGREAELPGPLSEFLARRAGTEYSSLSR